MVYHILNGDALAGGFDSTGLTGEIVVMREALIDGDLSGDTLPQFFQSRANYFKETIQENTDSYYATVVTEFEKLLQAPDHSEFNCWFGYDLFCRANMWFILSLLHNLPINKEVFAVYPSFRKREDIWKDFGRATTEDLLYCFNHRIHLTNKDLTSAKNLWTAFKNNDLARLEKLSKQPSPAFPYLEEVCQAHIERFPGKNEKGRPEKVVEEIIKNSTSDFHSVFVEFFKREGVYGFGDLQLKPIYDKVIESQ